MRIKSTPRKSCLVVEPYVIPKKTLLPTAAFVKTVVREVPCTNLVKRWSKVVIVQTPDAILRATPTGLGVSKKAMVSRGLGVGIVLAKTSAETALFTYCDGSDHRQVVNIQAIERSKLEVALALVGVSNKALESYERVANDDLQDRRE